MSLDLDFLTEILEEANELEIAGKYSPSEQKGPLRFFDKEMRCSSRNCSSPTFLKVRNAPRCTMHALRELNELVVDPNGTES